MRNALRRFAGDLVFEPIVGMHEVERHKPAPDGLLQILRQNPGCQVTYIGDTVDDALKSMQSKLSSIISK